jgi:hypothetical protein
VAERLAAIILAAGFLPAWENARPLLPLGAGTVMKQVIDLFKSCSIPGINRVLLSRIQNLPLADLLFTPKDYCCLNSIRWEENCRHVDAINRKSLN